VWCPGVLNTRGKMWKDERRFLHQKLIKLGMKKFGSGREQMEQRIQVINPKLDQTRHKSYL
jgi:polyhydroxyalkanoate synthesis regulator phasin